MRAAIIGLGVIGRVHYDVLEKSGEQIVALCDIDPQKLSFFAGKKYADYREMLEREPIDVVHICTPHCLHAEMTVFALQKNINVLCEKPLCITEEEIKAVLAAEKNASASLGVCFQNRYNDSSRFMKEYAKDRKILRAEGELRWHRDERYYRSAPWRGKWATEGGGVLINQAIHTLDLLQWIVGVPTEVIAVAENRAHQGIIETEDTVFAEFFGQKTFSLFATTTEKTDLPVRIRFFTEDGEIVMTPDSVTVSGRTQELSSGKNRWGKKVYGNGHEKLIEDFYECVKTGKKFPIDGQEGARSVRLVLAVYRSKGRRIGI